MEHQHLHSGGARFGLHAIPLSIAVMIGLGGPVVSAAATIDKFFTVQPIQVCDDAGASCAAVTTYEAETAKIYEQAGVAPIFLPTTTINSTTLLNSSDGVSDLDVAGNGQHSNSQVINAWFVQDIPEPLGILYGNAWVGANGVAVNAGAVSAFNSGNGRRDTFAHEVGHNFGLRHSNFGAGGSDNLMTSGSSRSVPDGTGNINPDGSKLSKLTADQITQVRGSSLVQAAPVVTVDTIGSTPFSTDDFFDITFTSAPAGVSLVSLVMDLRPVDAFFDITSAIPPGASGSPFAFSGLTGVAASDITVTDGAGGTLSDGDQILKLTFATGAFTAGDSFNFGVDVDLFSAIDSFGATPEELIGTLFDFQFSNSFASRAEMDADLVTSSIDVLSLLVPTVAPTGPGPMLPHGTIIDTHDPVAVPVPPTVLLIGTLWFGIARRHRANRR